MRKPQKISTIQQNGEQPLLNLQSNSLYEYSLKSAIILVYSIKNPTRTEDALYPGDFQTLGIMRNPRLTGKIILSTALLLILMGMLSPIVYSSFQGFITASHGKTTATPREMIEDNKQLDVLSRTSPAWRQELSKHIFISIDQELQSLEQELIRHDSAEGTRLIDKIKISLQRMISGKQEFLRTGQELALAPFYRGRTLLEYRLWQLKKLTQDLEMDQAQAHSVHRVYALMNKWLIYVSHREISARRKGTLGASPLPIGEQSTEETRTAFAQISEVTEITEQDMKEAGQALSQQPSAVQEAAPGTDSKTLQPQTPQESMPNLAEDNTASPQNEDTGSFRESSISNWLILLGAAGVILGTFLILRRKRNSTRLRASYKNNPENHLETDEQEADDLVEIHTLIDSRPTEDTGEEWPNDSEAAESAINSETPKGIPSQITVNLLEDDSKEGKTSQLEGLTQELKILHAEKEEIAQEMKTVLAEKDSLTQKLETFRTEKGDLEKQLESLHSGEKELTQKLEALHAEKEELVQGMDIILAEKDSLTENLETFRTEKNDLVTQLATLRFREEELSQDLENSIAENDSLAKQLEPLQTEKEDLEKQLETLRIEKEDFARQLEKLLAEKEDSFQALRNKLTESNSLTEKLETSRTEKEELDRQLKILRSREEELLRKSETLHAEKETIAQERESALAENNALTGQLEIACSENKILEIQLITLHSEKEESARGLENILAEKDSLATQLETLQTEKEGFEEQLQALRFREEKLAQEQEGTLTENSLLQEKLETFQTQKEQFTREAEVLRAEKEELGQRLEDILAENNSLTKQLEALHSREAELAQDLENTLTGNNSLAENRETAHAETNDLETLRSREEELSRDLETSTAENASLAEKLEASHAETNDLETQLETLQSREEKLAQDLENTLTGHNSLSKPLETLDNKEDLLAQEQNDTAAKFETLTETLEASREKNKILTKEQKKFQEKTKKLNAQLKTAQKQIKELTKELKSTPAKNETLTKKLKTAQEKNKTITKQNKDLTNQLETTQAEMDQRIAAEAEGLTRELQAMAFDVEDLKEKLGSTYLENETSAKDPKSINTTDLSFDHDTPEFADSQAEEPAMDEDTLAMDTIKENQDFLPASLPEDQETNHSDVILLQTILKAAKGFRNINERLYKIAETRLTPSTKDSTEDSQEKDSSEN